MADNDLTVLRTACQAFGQEIFIRGSTAYMLTRKADFEPIIKGSLAESVPPLADLDIVVRDEPAKAMPKVSEVLERYRTWAPACRFIHVDVFYEGLPVRADSPLGNVVIAGLPEVRIGADTGQNHTWTVTRAVQEEPVRASVGLKVPATLFRDFLFLLRLSQRHGELEGATEELAALLHSQSPRRIGRATREEGGVRELARIDKALVKHVLLRNAEWKPGSIRTYLRTDWLTWFSAYLNGLSRTIILSEKYWERTPAIAYVVDGRVVRFAEVMDLGVEEKAVLQKKLDFEAQLEAQTVGQGLTPSLEVMLPNADRPECCEYRDFSKGISELAWSKGNRGTLLNVALMEGLEKYYAVHAQASEGFGAQSLRTDPGFMGMLNQGALRAVRLVGLAR